MAEANNIYKQYEAPSGNGGIYLKLVDGKPVKVRIASEPYIFHDNYKGQISTKYAWVVYNLDEGKAQVLQLPVTGFRAVQAIAADDDWGDPTGYNLTVRRDGTGTDTKYQVTPTPNKTPLTDEQKAEVAKVDMTEAIKNAISLAAFMDGTEIPAPVDKGRDEVPAEAREPQGDDRINLDDIPF